MTFNRLGLAAIALLTVLAGCASGTASSGTVSSGTASSGPASSGTVSPGTAGSASVAGTVATAQAGSARSGACPARPPEAGSTQATATASLIPGGAVSAVICQYGNPTPKFDGPLPRIVLTGVAADGLAAVLDGAHPVSAPPGCSRVPAPDQVITFGYGTGPAVTAHVRFGDCSMEAAVTVGGQPAILSGQPAASLQEYAMIPRGESVPATPDLIGLSWAQAAVVAQRHGFSPYLGGAALDGAVPLGTVIFQSPPAGIADPVPGPGPQADLILAVPPVTACTASQLTLDYRGGGASAGNDFGAVVFRDTSATPCQLAGTVRLTGLNTAGQPDTRTIAASFQRPGVLSPRAMPVPANGNPAPGELVDEWPLNAEYRDAPTPSGLCQPDWVIPAAWRVVLPGGARFIVANADPSDHNPQSPTGGLITCKGNVSSDTPSYWTS